ncbi:MAG TPA: hypothetical protein VF981_16520 [Gemmatimonadaceae bacterium]
MSDERTWAREKIVELVLGYISAQAYDPVEFGTVLDVHERLVEAEAHSARSGQLLEEVRDALEHESRMDGVRLKAVQEAVRAAREG